jgi:hypothetical protein
VAQVKEPHYNICPHCKDQFWDKEISKEEVMDIEVHCEWGVDTEGNVLYGYSCSRGHLWLEVREALGDRHRHPGFGGASDLHDINREHQNPEYRHNLPENLSNEGDISDA